MARTKGSPDPLKQVQAFDLALQKHPYRHTVRIGENRYKDCTLLIGYRTHFITPPKWILKLIDAYARIRYRTSKK